jgi:hypothetical protein
MYLADSQRDLLAEIGINAIERELTATEWRTLINESNLFDQTRALHVLVLIAANLDRPKAQDAFECKLERCGLCAHCSARNRLRQMLKSPLPAAVGKIKTSALVSYVIMLIS